MKTFLKFLLVFTIVSVIKVNGQGIIIDHNCTDIDQIPVSVINDIKDNVKWQYGSLSHGNQLLCGILQAEDYNSIYNVEIGGEYVCCDKNINIPPYLPNVPGALCLYSGCNGMSNLGAPANDNWSSFIYHVQTTFDLNPTINVFQFSFCTELDSWSAAKVQLYLDVMTNLSNANPDVTFIYMTGNAKAGGIYGQEAGYNRYQRNEQIKQWCIDNNQICYDFADLECWYNGEMAYFIYEATGDTIPWQHPAYASEDCHHVNQLCTEVKGRAVWWMMARIRGWVGQTTSQSLDIKIFLQGNYSGSGMNTNLNSRGLLPLNQPYNISPINYNGNEAVVSIPGENIVEWVLIELRDAVNAESATSTSMVLRRAALLLSSGHIVDLDGFSNIQFNQTITDQLFIVIRHRNHLGIMSAYPLAEANNIYTYDFTTGIEKSFGGSTSQVELSTGIWGMIGGDGNLDGVVDNVDKTLTWTIDSGGDGYYSGDFTLNGNVNNQDKNLIWIVNFGKTSYIP